MEPGVSHTDAVDISLHFWEIKVHTAVDKVRDKRQLAAFGTPGRNDFLYDLKCAPIAAITPLDYM